MYELELIKHQETEARLREAALREHALVREKDELLAQKDILRRESEHRFLNGVQLIGSLLSLQSRTVGNAEVAGQLALAANRVGTLARVHRHLRLSTTSKAWSSGNSLKRSATISRVWRMQAANDR